METRRIGALRVPVVGLGCNNLGDRIDERATRAVVDAALEHGATFFDTADVYGRGASEEFLGRALGTRRDEVVIASKFGHDSGGPGRSGASARWIREAVDASLRRLGTDRIDLYQLHTPDDEVPIAETLGALQELVDAGKVIEIGHSNLDAEQTRAADEVAAERGTRRFVSAQIRWSVLSRDVEDEVVPACEALGLVVLPYFPLESGLLTGKYLDGDEDPTWRLAAMPAEQREWFINDRTLSMTRELATFAEGQGHSLLELAVSWLASQPSIASVIAGATRPEQVAANVGAAGWKLTEDELAEIDRITGRASVSR